MKHYAYCRAVACDRYGRIEGRGYCARCYIWWTRHGHERPASVNLRGQLRRCRHPGCPRRERALTRGWCRLHYQRFWRRFGPVGRQNAQGAVA